MQKPNDPAEAQVSTAAAATSDHAKHAHDVAAALQKLSASPQKNNSPNSSTGTLACKQSEKKDSNKLAGKQSEKKKHASNGTPCVCTPTLLKRTLSNASTEDNTDSFSTPTAQIKRGLTSSQDETPLRRCDSTDSAMHSLLGSSEEETTRPRDKGNRKHVGTFTPSVLDTASPDTDVSASQDTHVSASQDSLATLPHAPSPYDPENVACASASAEDTSPSTSVSSSSQAKEVTDVTSDNNKLEHDEYFEIVLKDANERKMVRPITRRPRLWQHHTSTLPALLAFDAIDDGVRLATAGIVWILDDRSCEIVCIASLGWKSRKGNSRSHQVRASGPIYAFVREADRAGTPADFSHISKVHIHSLFSKGEPASQVNVLAIQQARGIKDVFISDNQRACKSWKAVSTFKFHPKVTMGTRAPSRRLQMQKKKKSNVQDLKAEQLKKERDAKLAKLEQQKRSRELKAKIREVVSQTMENFKKNVNRQLKTVRGTVKDNKIALENTFEARLDNVSGDLKTRLEQQLKDRVQELADKVDELTSQLDSSNELRVRCAKRTRRMLDTLNGMVESNTKHLKKAKAKTKKQKSKAKAKAKVKRKAPKENVESAPAAPAIASRPPTPMVNTNPHSVYSMYTSPPAVQNRVAMTGSHTPPVPHFQPNGPQYVSPAYANRNFAR